MVWDMFPTIQCSLGPSSSQDWQKQTISIARFWYRCRAPMEWAIWAMGPCPVGWGVLPMKKKTWARYTIPETNILSMEEIRRSPVDVGSIQYIPVFIGFLHHPRWLFGISSINSSTWTWMVGRWHFLLGPNACFQVAFAVSFRVSTCYCRFLWLYMSLGGLVWFRHKGLFLRKKWWSAKFENLRLTCLMLCIRNHRKKSETFRNAALAFGRIDTSKLRRY